MDPEVNDRMRTLEYLLKIEPEAVSDKSVAANVLLELSVAAGIVSAVFLAENGEETFRDILDEIKFTIDVSAHQWAESGKIASAFSIVH